MQYKYEPISITKFIPEWDEDMDDLRAALKVMTGYAGRNPRAVPYVGDIDKASTYIDHPFTDETWVAFVGHVGVTASIGGFLHAAAFAMPEGIVEDIRVWLVENKEYNGFMVFADCDHCGERTLVSGMTDFSGEGGGGHKIMSQVVKAISWITEDPIPIIQIETPESPDILLSRLVDAGERVGRDDEC